MVDLFLNYQALAATRREGVDYRVRLEKRESSVAIVAPHGGKIEPGTSQIAAAVAGNSYDLYCFEGTMPAGNRALHVTSTNFDEPRCLDLVARCDVVLTVHGCAGDNDVTYLGGLDEHLCDLVKWQLDFAGFETSTHPDPVLAGRSPINIVNRSATGRGTQLELSASLRERLEGVALGRYAAAVRIAIAARLQALADGGGPIRAAGGADGNPSAA